MNKIFLSVLAVFFLLVGACSKNDLKVGADYPTARAQAYLTSDSILMDGLQSSGAYNPKTHITGYHWQIVHSPNPYDTIIDRFGPKTSFLKVKGYYEVYFEIKDNYGGTSYDYVRLTVP